MLTEKVTFFEEDRDSKSLECTKEGCESVGYVMPSVISVGDKL